jgi:hypothetical protein
MPRPLHSRGKSPRSTHWVGGWVGPRAGLDAMAKEKNPHRCPCRELNPVRPVRNLVYGMSYTSSYQIRGPFENFMDWRACGAVIASSA